MAWYWIVVAALGGGAVGFFAAALAASAKRAQLLSEIAEQDSYLLTEMVGEPANDRT